jgi:hypothetical protein
VLLHAYFNEFTSEAAPRPPTTCPLLIALTPSVLVQESVELELLSYAPAFPSTAIYLSPPIVLFLLTGSAAESF